MIIRQFVYGCFLTGMINPGNTLASVVEYLEDCVITYGVWGNVDGLSCITGLPRGLVEDIIVKGKVYCG
jgi:hypothetical protein